MMRIGLIGPAADDQDKLRKAVELFMADEQIGQIIYLGMDGAVETLLSNWGGESLDTEHFLRRGAELACSGEASEIERLLSEEKDADRFERIRCLPEPPARAVEMLDRWIVLAVHDKAILDEEDIANAHIIVYGRSSGPDFKRFGPRCFLTPGPLSAGRIGLIELKPEGHLDVSLLDLDGEAQLTESVHSNQAKLVVSP